MSDQSQGPGWWLASDGKWYPPQSPSPPSTPPPSPPAPAQMLVAKGVTGTVSFDSRMVSITHRGLGRLTAGKGEKRIPVSRIAAVEWKPPGLGVRGFIRFTIPGGLEQRSRVGRRTKDATRDENSVVFGRRHRREFERLRTAVEQAISM